MVIPTAGPHTSFDKRERLCYYPPFVSPFRMRPDPLRFRPYTFHRRLKRGLNSGTRSYDVRQLRQFETISWAKLPARPNLA